MCIRDRYRGIKVVGSLIWGAIKAAPFAIAAYLLWYYFSKKGQTGYPRCLDMTIPKEDWEKIYKEGRDHILNSDTGIEDVDNNGGGRFYQDGRFETENKKFKGKWEKKGDIISIVLDDKTEYSMPCQEIETDEELEVEKGWDGTYVKQDNFPFGLGSQNSKIADIQFCLGLDDDGRFSPQLQTKLEELGYGSEITNSVYNQIMKKCGMGKQQRGYLSSFVK